MDDEKMGELERRITSLEEDQEALEVAQQNRRNLRELDDRLGTLIRSFNAIACVICGALLLWFGNSLVSDSIVINDRIGEWLMMGGGGCIGFGLLVLTKNDGWLLTLVESINPWKR